MKLLPTAAALAALVGLAACETEPRATLSANFGEAVRNNMAVHIVNPAPQYSAAEENSLDGPRATGAYDRYRDGKVYKPTPDNTSSLKAQSRGGGGK